MWAQNVEITKSLPCTVNRLSKIFQPVNILPKNVQVKTALTSRSQRLMLNLGIIRQASPGAFYFLPLGVRALNKLTSLVDKQMDKIGAQKVIFPSLTRSNLWNSTGRLQDFGSELFVLKDRHDHSYVLGPTHEEAAADLIASVSQLTHKDFPIKLYQITDKYRDEIKPRFGLIRGKQFIMKDLYTFDTSVEKAKDTYEEICQCYDNIFSEIGVQYIKAIGSCGTMGGFLSHEYHYKAEIGEDKILHCTHCGSFTNSVLFEHNKCVNCDNSQNFTSYTGIEVGHTFLLGAKYSQVLNANYLSDQGKVIPLQMGSYGLGITRILAAAIELLSKENEIRWPQAFAPYLIMIIPPKKGSKEEKHSKHLPDRLYNMLETVNALKGNIIIDDRTQYTIGRRVIDALKVGYPFTIVIGAKSMEAIPLYELSDISTNETIYLNEEQLLAYVKGGLKINMLN
ncbi:hypothetical protein FQA39_LY14556 [Lamprigera yunnana]|nr:hypothetical protein FQA39_LY14556 [Lamprigera yunnana]